MSNVLFNGTQHPFSRRDFIGFTAKAGLATLVVTATGPLSGLVSVVQAATKAVIPFRFAILTDAHLFDIANHKFDGILTKAVAEVNALNPAPDFVVYLGDIAQSGKQAELEKGKSILSKLTVPMRVIPGEHDWYLDMGHAWKGLFGTQNWSFNHKGVHFIGMNSILVRDFWTVKNLTPVERMAYMEELECHRCGLWGVREEQLEWLKADVKNISPNTPVIIFTHSPLWDYYPRWNFQTEDAPAIRAILGKFTKVMAFHGHVHQVVYNKIGNMTSIGTLSTSWPWPYPAAQLPYPNIKMNRVDPGDIFDGLGSQFVDLDKIFQGKHQYQPFSDLLPEPLKKGIKV